MQKNHPQERVNQQHQRVTSPSQNTMPVTWGQAINTEHARMQKSLPYDAGQAPSQKKPDTVRPSTWGQAIDAEKQRIEQTQ
ncbi:hypothetical protein [Methylophaga sp.]|uniref:hypothetical protein n=1 Tax=Methylophaga sp. TaxID=2024840 RepID=UPI003F69DCCA